MNAMVSVDAMTSMGSMGSVQPAMAAAPEADRADAPDSAAREAMVGLHAASVRFGSVTALHEATLQVARGEFIALIGANGSGKTTLLQTLHGLVAHTGTRTVGNGAAAQVMVFQRPFMLRLSVWNNLRVALWLARVPSSERAARAVQALRRVGLADLRDRPARALSGGQQQRLALARAWATQPTLLFLDEPTASLDPSAKNEIETLLAGFAAEGMTIVMSTHNLGQAKRLATRVVYLDHGAICADLPTARFFEAHAEGPAALFLKGELTWDMG
ncbi:phosphate ABC transporter ATP-binding protein [soil metagenome]